VNTTGDGLLDPPERAPGCKFPPKPAEGAGGQGSLRAWSGTFHLPHILSAAPRLPPQKALHLPISMGFSCRLSVLPESEACVPNAALRSRSVRRLVLKDLMAAVV
jgi:hypothetical protein